MNDINQDQAKLLLWTMGDLSYLFNENQEVIYHELQQMKGREVSLLLARRFGKSYFAIIYATMMCLQKGGFRIGVVAKNQEQVRKIVGPITDWLVAQAPEGFIKKTTSRFELLFPKTNSKLIILGAEASADNYRGIGLDLAICEETASWEPPHYENMMVYILKPMLRKSKEKLKIIHVTTPSPKYVDHPFHTDMLKMPNLKLTIYDDKTSTKEQIEECIQDSGGEDTHAFRIEYLCQVSRNEEVSVLPAFNVDSHVVEPVDYSPYYVLASYDAGGTRDHSAYVEGILYKNQIRIIHSKDWSPMTSIDEMSEYMLSRKVDKRIGDLSGQVEIEFAQRGLHFVFPSKTNVEIMLTELNSAFRKDEIVIDFIDDNMLLIDECQAAQFNNNRTDFARTEKFGHCDLVSALNYLYRMRKFLKGAKNRYVEGIRDSEALSNMSSTAYYRAKVKQQKKKEQLQKLVRR